MWKSFELQSDESFGLPDEGVDAAPVRCINCGQMSLRWYRTKGTHRPDTAFVYVWCSSCRHFWSQTYFAPAWTLPDPLEGMTEQEWDQLDTDLDKFFALLDRLWSVGRLPQVRGRQD